MYHCENHFYSILEPNDNFYLLLRLQLRKTLYVGRQHVVTIQCNQICIVHMY